MQRDQLDGTLPRGKGAAEQRPGPRELSPAEERRVAELKQIDRKVREHEAAHLRAGQGVVTSGANFTYTYGPDGKQYAVGGEVGIDTSKEAEPEDNIDKGIRIQAAALAPRDPSPQDYRVAGIGSQLESQGRSDLAAQQRAEQAAAAQARQEAVMAAEDAAAAASADGEMDSSRERVAQAYGLASQPGQGGGISVFA
jgi:hypothetical protein